MNQATVHCRSAGHWWILRVSELTCVCTHVWACMCPHSGPCCASYLARTFLVRPSSFLRSATSCRRAEFSFSRKLARMAIWFSFSRLASRDRLAARLFFLRRAQYLSSCSKDDTREEGRSGKKTSKKDKKDAKLMNQVFLDCTRFRILGNLSHTSYFNTSNRLTQTEGTI